MLATPKGKSQLYLASSLCDGLEDNNIKQVTTLLLVKEANPNVLIPSQGITPFHLVIGNDSETFAEEVTKLFLRHGGNPNVRSVDGMTPVHVAAAWGRVGVLDILLAHGGNPLSLDDDGRSPFHYAYDGAYYDAIAVLGKYCGDQDEDDDDKPKYKLTLEKIRINKRNIVEEYVISDTSQFDMKSITNLTSSIPSEEATYSSTAPKSTDVPEKCLDYRNTRDTTTTDDESFGSSNFITLRRHQLCLPKSKKKRVSKAIDMTDIEFHQVERSVEDEKLLVNEIINRLSASFADNSPTVYDYFNVPVKAEGERMPRISSPKNDVYVPHNILSESPKVPTKLVESKKVETSQSVRKKIGNQFSYNTPRRIKPKKKSESVPKKNPCSISANVCTPRNNTPVNKLARTPSRLPTKLTYSPDCSIVSKSPNFRIPSNCERKVRATKTPSLQKKNSPKVSRICYTPGQQRTRSRIPSESRLPRFVENPNIQHQTSKSVGRSQPTPKSLKDRKTPRSAISKKTPNSLNPKKKRENVTPLNKTYSKKDLVPFSPELDNAILYQDYRNCTKKGIAVKLEESMYDEDTQTKCPSYHIQDETIDRRDWTLASNLECGKMSEILAGHMKSWRNIEETMSENEQLITEDNDSDKRVCVDNKLLPELNRKHIEISGIKSLLTEESSMESLVRSRLFGLNVERNRTSNASDIKYDKKMVNTLQHNRVKSPIDRFSHRYRDSTSSDTDRQTLSDYGSGNYSWSSNQFYEEECSCRRARDSEMISEDLTQNGDLRLSTGSDRFSGTFMSCYGSFISVEEEYKYEDAEMGIVLLERRLRVPPPCVLSNMEPRSRPKNKNNQVDEIAETLKKELNIEERPEQKSAKKKSPPGSGKKNSKTGKKNAPKEDDNNAISDPVENYIIKPLKSLEAGRKLELEAFQCFANPDENSKFARGNRIGQAPKKEFFNYLLLDSRVTQDLPRRGRTFSFVQQWNIFCDAIFYVGKGKRNRPFSHFYSATPMYDKAASMQIAGKIRYIVDIWKSGNGVVSLHVFQNTIEDEALTREACMIDALGLKKLKNEISGTYYGPAAAWSSKDKCKLGTFLLQEALQIYMHEGERQIHRKHI